MMRFLPPLLFGCLLAGCADERVSYPSLAPRAVEKLGFDEPATTPLHAVADPTLDGQVTQQGATLDAIARGFDRDAAAATRAAAAAGGQAVGSEAWLTAQTALATLDDWRAQASAAATEIERLAVDRAAQLKPAYPSLEALQTRARGETDRQTATIRRLQDSLPAA